jgi:parallel beta-helix repeat protein
MFLLSLFLCVATIPILDFKINNGISPVNFERTNQSDHAPITIESDSDFETQDWSGNGSINNPYLIEGLQIVITETYQSCITIQNVSSYYVIQDCSFSYDDRIESEQRQRGYGVTLIRTLNGRIVNCTFKFLEYGLYTYASSRCTMENCTYAFSRVGVNLRSSTDWIIVNSSFMHCFDGFQLDSVSASIVANNTVLFNEIGVLMYTTSECNLTSNLIAYNTVIGVSLSFGCSMNHIFNNRIAFNQEESIHEDVNAQDDGYDNLWDDNVSVGNEWGDYSGIGVYAIPGSAGSIDRYPSVATFDFAGPILYNTVDYRVTAAPITCPFYSVSYYTSAYDQSGVDKVLLYYSSTPNGSWSFIELEYLPTPSYPYRYSYIFSGPLYSLDFIRYYYFWANDTLGHESTSEMYGTWLYCIGANSPTNPNNWSSVTAALIMGAGGIAIVVTLTILRRKGRDNPWPRVGYG